MITANKIPLNAATFIRRCTDDVLNGRYAATPDGYLEYLIAVTQRRNPKLLEYIRVLDRRTGKPRYIAEADHIIPRGVWGILMFGIIDRDRCGTSFNVLSNLFWRDPQQNRTDDHQSIALVRRDAAGVRLSSRAGFEWRQKWIEIFLRTKRDEVLPFHGDIVDPHDFDQIPSAGKDSNWLNRD